VRVTISDASNGNSQRDLALIEWAQTELATLKNVPTIEEVRAALASIPGSVSDDVIADRGEY
jgi:hypothetical protein